MILFQRIYKKLLAKLKTHDEIETTVEDEVHVLLILDSGLSSALALSKSLLNNRARGSTGAAKLRWYRAGPRPTEGIN